jgi:aspartyl-tRNA(Asn)/glutamyl-tRNA(Gln) amidotransferase subunit A
VLPGNLWFDNVGPLARSVSDIRILAGVLLGHDSEDDACRRVDWQRLDAGLRGPGRGEASDRDRPLAGLRVGVVEGDLFEIDDERLRRQFEANLQGLEDAGATLVPVRLPGADVVMATLLAADLPASASLHTETLLSRGTLVDRRIRALLEFAHQVPAALVGRAHQVRRSILAAVAEAFRSASLDILAAPGMVAPRIEHGEEDAVFHRAHGDPEGVLSAYVRPHALTALTGQPTIVLPTGDSKAPGSLQIIGRPFADGELLRTAESVEAWLARHPTCQEVP